MLIACVLDCETCIKLLADGDILLVNVYRGGDKNSLSVLWKN